MDNTRAQIRPEIATPWPGFERGVIECNSCGYTTPDENARRGRIQKCGQCAKVLYIPSGLYRITPAVGQPAPRYKESHGFFWWVQDRLGARLNRFSRSRYRLPIAFLLFVMGVALLVGLYYLKNQTPPVPVKESALSIYYKNVLAIDKKLVTAEDEFDKGSGGKPQSMDEFADKASANNKTRFVRAADRMEKQVEGFLSDAYAMQATLPAGAEAHYAALKTKLEEYQKYYARLKDGVDQKNEARWKEAFAGADILKQAKTNEEQAFNQLQATVLTPTQITAKA